MKENEDIEEAIVTVHKMTEDEKMRRLADLREKAIMDEKAIRRKGYEDGMEKRDERTEQRNGMTEERKRNEVKTRQSIEKMKEIGLTNEQICEILNLTPDELKKLV